MVEGKMSFAKRQTFELVQAEELINRFKSKEDIWRYRTQQGKYVSTIRIFNIVGIFLPSMAGTKISFMRDILSEEKLALK